MQLLLYLVFVLSGAAGLIYESIWTRYLGLFAGHGAYAQIIVLTIFLAGMSIGAMLVGRRSEQLRDPLVAYAWVELAVGVIGFVFHDLYVAVTRWAYDAVFPHLAGTSMLLVVKWGIAGALILPQSILLGMTFPLMSAAVLRLARQRPGRVLAFLYFTNSFGAAIGVLVAGFYLVRLAGLPGTLIVAAILNAVVFLAALSGARFLGPRQTRDPIPVPPSLPEPPTVSAEDVTRPHQRRSPMVPIRMLLAIAFGTAISSFIYEIAWIRMLSLVLGSATHSFELMLSAFILGLSLGALWVHRRADQFADPLRTLAIVQCLMGLAALATIPLYLQSFQWTASMIAALEASPQGYVLFAVARYAFCLVVMLPATFFAGMTLPLITRQLLVGGEGERAVGLVYAVNTFGSIVGVVLAGLVLLPVLGLKLLLISGAVIDMALGVVLIWRPVAPLRAPLRRNLAWGALAGLAAATVLSVLGNRFDENMLSSGVYRFGRLQTAATRQILSHRDGRTATVTVGRSLGDKSFFIATNGKPDASIDTAWYVPSSAKVHKHALDGDEPTQVLIPLLTLAHAPHAKQAAIIGVGSGITSHLLLGSRSIQRAVTLEIEPEMYRGARLFYPVNGRLFDDPRSQVVFDDAKSFFAIDGHRYDIIISEPSNPWVSGVSGLFTDEFYQRVRRYLSPDGVFGQWLHLYELDDQLVLSVLAALHHNFRSYNIYMTSPGDLIIVASMRAALQPADWSVFQEPDIAADLGHVPPFTARALQSAFLISRDEAAPLLDDWRGGNSDFYPVLDLGAEQTRFLHTAASGFIGLSEQRFDPIAPFTGRRAEFSTIQNMPVRGIPRMRALAVSAALHAKGSASDTLDWPEVTAALERRWALDGTLSAATPPADWRAWVQQVAQVEKDLHGGTAGVADEAFYASVTGFLDRLRAPSEARDAVTFLHGIAAWNFESAARATDRLAPSAVAGHPWVPIDLLRDGGVVSKLRIGDVTGARATWAQLSPHVPRPPNDLRTMLLAAYLEAAARRGPDKQLLGVR